MTGVFGLHLTLPSSQESEIALGLLSFQSLCGPGDTVVEQVSAFVLRNRVRVACERLKSPKAVKGSKGETK